MLASLRSRLVFTHFLVGGLVLVLLAVSFLAIQVSNPAAERFVFERLDLISRAAAAQNRIRPAIFEQVPLERTLAVLGRGIGATGVVVNASGRILAEGPGQPPALPLEVIDRSLAAADVSRGSFSLPGGGRWLYLSRPIAPDQYLILLAPRPTFRTVLTQLRELLAPLWQAALLALLASVALSLLLARWVSQPLDRLRAASGQVAAGDFEQQVEPQGPTEIRDVAGAFNDMVARVRDSQQAQREFIANISHELKTPLTSIAGFAQAIVDGTIADGPEQRRAAEIINEEAQRLRRMVDQLLSLARFDAGQVQLEWTRFQVEDLLRSCAERIQPAALAAGVELQLDFPELAAIVADHDRLAQVVINLLDNAIRHTSAGGWVRLHAREESKWISVSVEDNGAGLSTRQLNRIFERFYQVDPSRAGGSGSGMGLGLAISHEIIKAHGGRMNAESVLGEGSRISFRVAVTPAEASTVS